jgi:hypothetical protein
MEALKKHYEKVLLGVVLLGLVVGAAFLPLMIASERQSLRDMAEAELTRKPKELDPLDLSKSQQLLARLQAALRLDFSSSHKVFNPVVWKRKAPPENTPIKAQKGNVGVEAITVIKTAPLHTIVSLDSVTMTDSGPRYTIGVEREAAATSAQRKKRAFYAAPKAKSDGGFVIVEVKGPPDNPDELVLELSDSGERVVVKKDAPLRRVDGYTADLKYEPENRRWTNLRVGAGGPPAHGTPATPPISVENESYIVVAINKNEVVLSAKSNNKKTSLPYNPGERP